MSEYPTRYGAPPEVTVIDAALPENTAIVEMIEAWHNAVGEYEEPEFESFDAAVDAVVASIAEATGHEPTVIRKPASEDTPRQSRPGVLRWQIDGAVGASPSSPTAIAWEGNKDS